MVKQKESREGTKSSFTRLKTATSVGWMVDLSDSQSVTRDLGSRVRVFAVLFFSLSYGYSPLSEG